MNEDWLTLFDAATQARASAYCPYSGYQVGAAILANNGRVYSGANVENRSFGATICAERHAIGAMIADGGTAIVRILVVTSDAVAPCGMCLQVIAEFGMSQTPIAKSFASGELTETTLGALLPHRFESDEVPRKY